MFLFQRVCELSAEGPFNTFPKIRVILVHPEVGNFVDQPPASGYHPYSYQVSLYVGEEEHGFLVLILDGSVICVHAAIQLPLREEGVHLCSISCKYGGCVS